MRGNRKKGQLNRISASFIIGLALLAQAVYADQISPNPNPAGNEIVILGNDQNALDFINNGIITIHDNGTAILDNTKYLMNNTGGTLNNNGTLNNSGTLNNDGVLTNSGTLNNSDYLSNRSGGIITNSGTLNNNSTLRNYATITNSGQLTNYSGSALYNHNIFTNTGTLDNYGNMGLEGSSFQLTNAGTLNNYGSFMAHDTLPGSSCKLSNTGTLNNYNEMLFPFASVDNHGSLNNQSGGTLLFTSFNNYSDGTLNNSGTLQNYGFLDNSGMLINTGTLNNNGNLNNNSGGTINNYGTINNSLSFTNQGIYSGTGTFNGAFQNNGGTIKVGDSSFGTITIDESANIYSDGLINRNGTLIFKIGGLDVGMYDVMQIIYGYADFYGGNIVFDFVDGFEASAGNYWDFLHVDVGIAGWETLSFTFNGLDSGLEWDFEYLDTGWMRLALADNGNVNPPVPEPSTMLLLGSGLLALAGFRKRTKK